MKCFLPCKICSIPVECQVRRNKATLKVCSACKKFMQRHSKININDVKCISGSYNCTVDSQSATSTSTGLVLRMICPRCRLSKLLAARGSRRTPVVVNVDQNQSTSSSSDQMKDTSSNTSSTPSSYVSDSCDKQESHDGMAKLLTATRSLLDSVKHLALQLHGNYQLQNETDAWLQGMNHFEQLTTLVGKFIKSLPGMCSLTIENRCDFFPRSFWPIAFAVTNYFNESPLTMSATSAQAFTTFFPELRHLFTNANALKGVFENWDHDETDFACLLGLIFVSASRGGASELHNIIDKAMRNKFGFNMESVNNSTDVQQIRLYSIMVQIDAVIERFRIAMAQIEIRIGELFKSSQMFYTVFAKMVN